MNPFFQKITNKIQDWSTAAQTIQKWQNNGAEVVFTNGCFDLVHFGHLAYLAEAAAQGTETSVGAKFGCLCHSTQRSTPTYQRPKKPCSPIS